MRTAIKNKPLPDYWIPMRLSFSIGFLLAAACSVPSPAQQGTPRDTFWSASDLVSVSSNPAAKAPVKPPARPPTRSRSGHVDPVLVASNGYGQQPHMVHVSTDQIGLRYSLLLRDSQRNYLEESPTAVFHSGDHLRLSVMANQPGYLYVIQQGSTGSWTPIFPRAGSAEEVNKVEQGRVLEIPDGKQFFRFDQNPGQEKLFIVLSRQPIRDLDSTIESLKKSASDQPATPAAENGASLEASNHIPDELVQRFAKRDLTLVDEQEVDETPKGSSSGEKAVYVVSKGTTPSSGPQVVAQVILRHE